MMESVAPNRPRAPKIDWWRLWRRSGGFRNAADLRPWSRERGSKEGSVEREKNRGRRWRRGFRFESDFAFEGGGV